MSHRIFNQSFCFVHMPICLYMHFELSFRRTNWILFMQPKWKPRNIYQFLPRISNAIGNSFSSFNSVSLTLHIRHMIYCRKSKCFSFKFNRKSWLSSSAIGTTILADAINCSTLWTTSMNSSVLCSVIRKEFRSENMRNWRKNAAVAIFSWLISMVFGFVVVLFKPNIFICQFIHKIFQSKLVRNTQIICTVNRWLLMVNASKWRTHCSDWNVMLQPYYKHKCHLTRIYIGPCDTICKCECVCVCCALFSDHMFWLIWKYLIIICWNFNPYGMKFQNKSTQFGPLLVHLNYYYYDINAQHKESKRSGWYQLGK